jgi:hypothetical protein
MILILQPVVRAEDTIGIAVTFGYSDLEGEPGSNLHSSINIGNIGNSVVRIIAQSSGEMAPWVAFDKNNFTLVSGESIIVVVMINIPPDTPFGNYNCEISVDAYENEAYVAEDYGGLAHLYNSEIYQISVVSEAPIPTPTPTPTPSPTPTPNPTIPTQGRCLIATATYGSELSPEVSFLRIFRDQTVMSTFAGKQFMTIFNAWYYSFSPPVARTISDNTVVKPIMKAILYPLIGTLHVAEKTNSALSILGPELAMVVAGLVASCLIGMAYLAPISLVTLFAFRRYYRTRIGSYPLCILAGLALSSGTLLAIGELMMMPVLVMFSVTMLVLTTFAISGIAFARFVIKNPK